MSINCYLAMTAAEFSACEKLPQHIAWMACHFSCYGAGLSNLPSTLPSNSMVILNDRTPLQGHDICLIVQQLTTLAKELSVSRFLLDFQRPGNEAATDLAKMLVKELPCPVGVTDLYGKDLSCPVFLPPPLLHVPLEQHLAPWKNREIWLEAAPTGTLITVTQDGSQIKDCLITHNDKPVFEDADLNCEYSIEVNGDQANFRLYRNNNMLGKMLCQAETLGVTLAVGLYQQLGDFKM